MTHSLTAALDQLRVVASSIEPSWLAIWAAPTETGQCLLALVATKFFVDDPADASSQQRGSASVGFY